MNGYEHKTAKTGRIYNSVPTEKERNLKVGGFYWVWPVLDADRGEEWEYYEQPARFAGFDVKGKPLWQCIGYEDATWPMRWIGEEIVFERSAK